ncbi:MAG: hypothetical protein NXH97_21040 [Rhodobacteraceae bacterium]|nr:hypothetical protein [Paracoccaceae bacterium]
MIQNLLPDFVIAARIDAHYKLKVEEWEAARRVDERVEKMKEEQAKPAEDSATVLIARIVSGVPARELARMESRLGDHQEALIDALQDNRERLDRAEQHIDDLLSKAHVLEDGRRVFETEDGTLVYDEFGHEVADEEITPEEIDDSRPKWEAYQQGTSRHDSLVQEQSELLEYQERLDEAETKMQAGALSRGDYDALDDLLNDAPSAVRGRLPKTDTAHTTLDSNTPDNALDDATAHTAPGPSSTISASAFQ